MKTIRLKIIERAQHFEKLRNEYLKSGDYARAASMHERSVGLRDAAAIAKQETVPCSTCTETTGQDKDIEDYADISCHFYGQENKKINE